MRGLTTGTRSGNNQGVRIPSDALIAEEKLTKYLLVRREWDDKSGFLQLGGFTLDNWQELRDAIRRLASDVDAFEDGDNEYGTFYRIEGELVGPSASLAVVLVWMRRSVDNQVYFVTLKPRKV